MSSIFWSFSTKFFKVDAAAVCRNAPPAPFSKAATALPIAAMLVFSSLDRVANSAASFSRMAVASAMAVFAAALSVCAVFKSSLSWPN